MTDDAFKHADAETRAAVQMLKAGEIAAGLERYRAALQVHIVHRIPAGLHVALLKEAGQHEAAESLRLLALRHGLNLAVRAALFEVPRGAAMAEYEALFAAGSANAQMVGLYLQALSAEGRADALRRWLAPELLFRAIRLDRGQAAEVEQAMLALEADAPLQPEEKSARGMRRLHDLHRERGPALRGLFETLTAETQAYMRHWAANDHPLAALVPTQIELRAWGQISRGQGSNVPHTHPAAWATGVYYPKDAGGGALCIGGPDGPATIDADAANGWFEKQVLPEAGLLVLMPSFYTHWTLPLGRPGLRLSIAYDAVADGQST